MDLDFEKVSLNKKLRKLKREISAKALTGPVKSMLRLQKLKISENQTTNMSQTQSMKTLPDFKCLKLNTTTLISRAQTAQKTSRSKIKKIELPAR